ncbi:MAG: hypothetical protein ACPF8V_11270, partial [Luteibaculum sp.]
MKNILNLIILFGGLSLFGQKNAYTYLGSDKYQPLMEADTIRDFHRLRFDNQNRSYVELGFKIPILESSRLIFEGAGNSFLFEGAGISYQANFLSRVKYDNNTGHPIGKMAQVKHKVIRDNGIPVKAIVEVEGIQFDSLPGLNFGFQIVVQRNGLIELHYANHDFTEENYSNYRDIFFYWRIVDENTGENINHLVVTGDVSYPRLYDNSDSISIEDFTGFDYFPNGDLSFQINSTKRGLTSISTVAELDEFYTIKKLNKTWKIESKGSGAFDVQVLSSTGALIEKASSEAGVVQFN